MRASTQDVPFQKESPRDVAAMQRASPSQATLRITRLLPGKCRTRQPQPKRMGAE